MSTAAGHASGNGAGTSNAELASVVREHAGRLAVALMAVTGDFSTAEDLVQDAVVTALRRWPTEGIPDRPDAWLFTVARNRGLDVLRREANYRAKLAQLQWPVQPEPDERRGHSCFRSSVHVPLSSHTAVRTLTGGSSFASQPATPAAGTS
jgi:DNA-directed RNA polymerase specialized sigma24 family protein